MTLPPHTRRLIAALAVAIGLGVTARLIWPWVHPCASIAFITFGLLAYLIVRAVRRT